VNAKQNGSNYIPSEQKETYPILEQLAMEIVKNPPRRLHYWYVSSYCFIIQKLFLFSIGNTEKEEKKISKISQC
jgi:hypothetical protein